LHPNSTNEIAEYPQMLLMILDENIQGLIIQRQTTFLTLRDTMSGEVFRVDYEGKKEWSLSEGLFDGFQILRSHPLLEQYQQVYVDIYLAGSPTDPYRTASMIHEALLTHFKSWRGYSSYGIGNLVQLLSSGWGLLYRGPSEAASLIVDILDSEMIEYSSLNSGRTQGEVKLLLLGRNYVVANDFRISKLD
jgi:hypothetical protein